MKQENDIISITHDEPVTYANLTFKKVCAACGAKAEELKAALIRRLSAEYAEVGAQQVYQAVNEAISLASSTIAPLLFLPVLAEEKVQGAASRSSARLRSSTPSARYALAL